MDYSTFLKRKYVKFRHRISSIGIFLSLTSTSTRYDPILPLMFFSFAFFFRCLPSVEKTFSRSFK